MTHPNTITVVACDTAEAIEYHQPGCSHQQRRAVRQTDVYEYKVTDLQAIQAEAKDLGCRNPIAPCLRKVIR